MVTTLLLQTALDDALKALTVFDADQLEAIEQRIASLQKQQLAFSVEERNLLSAKKDLLGTVVERGLCNLWSLRRLNNRNVSDLWAH